LAFTPDSESISCHVSICNKYWNSFKSYSLNSLFLTHSGLLLGLSVFIDSTWIRWLCIILLIRYNDIEQRFSALCGLIGESAVFPKLYIKSKCFSSFNFTLSWRKFIFQSPLGIKILTLNATFGLLTPAYLRKCSNFHQEICKTLLTKIHLRRKITKNPVMYFEYFWNY
jgi:hypothetical protein